jgi:hypothetical protein
MTVLDSDMGGEDAKAAGRRGKRASWSKDQVETLRQMWLAGASDVELTESLGRSANAIAIKAHRMGLPPRAEAVAVMAHQEQERRRAAGEEVDEAFESRPKPTAKIRNCLMCGVKFWSSHAGERICPDCKSTDFWRNGAWMEDHSGGGWF